jgi:hypothetical protein
MHRGTTCPTMLFGTMSTKALNDLLQRAKTWPRQDQEALLTFARELKARRCGVYRLSDGERAAIQTARQEGFVPDEEMDAYWKRYV